MLLLQYNHYEPFLNNVLALSKLMRAKEKVVDQRHVNYLLALDHKKADCSCKLLRPMR
jgi:hypothetical protein